MKQLHKKQNLGKKGMNKVFEILGHLPYVFLERYENFLSDTPFLELCFSIIM